MLSLLGSTRAKKLAGAVSKQVGDLKLDYGREGVAESLRAKAKQLHLLGVRRVKPYVGGISRADKEAREDNTDWERGVRLGQFDYMSASTST